MMTVTESTASSMSQSIDYNNYSINRSYPTMTYDYRHHNPWDKAAYTTFHHHQTPLFSTGTIPSINKSFDTVPNLNNTNFYRRHTESTFPSSPSIYSSSTSTHSSTIPFDYSHPPPGLFFGWNNGASLMRTHSASYQDYPGSTSYPAYNPNTVSSSQPTTNKPTVSSRVPQNPYPPFFNVIPPINFSLPPPSSITNHSVSHTSKRSIPSKVTKRPRLTAHIRSEIVKLTATKSSICIGEIQQNLLQNGICNAKTLPNAPVIQRILNESLRNSVIIKEEPKINLNLQSILNTSSPVTICLSPSPSPTLSNGEAVSECSICLESYRSGQEVSILACSHEYHSSCIGEWMVKNRSCPMCRKDIHNQPQFVTLLI